MKKMQMAVLTSVYVLSLCAAVAIGRRWGHHEAAQDSAAYNLALLIPAYELLGKQDNTNAARVIKGAIRANYYEYGYSKQSRT